jgi:hypothetical protein
MSCSESREWLAEKREGADEETKIGALTYNEHADRAKNEAVCNL